MTHSPAFPWPGLGGRQQDRTEAFRKGGRWGLVSLVPIPALSVFTRCPDLTLEFVLKQDQKGFDRLMNSSPCQRLAGESVLGLSAAGRESPGPQISSDTAPQWSKSLPGLEPFLAAKGAFTSGDSSAGE